MTNSRRAALRAAGYGAIWHGQKSWNGVATLARGAEPVETRRGLPGDPDDSHSRYIEVAIGGAREATLRRHAGDGPDCGRRGKAEKITAGREGEPFKDIAVATPSVGGGTDGLNPPAAGQTKFRIMSSGRAGVGLPSRN